MSNVHLTVLPNGPLLVAGELEIVDVDGRQLDVDAWHVYLCRCGRSANKPFCDGSHVRTEWNDREEDERWAASN